MITQKVSNWIGFCILTVCGLVLGLCFGTIGVGAMPSNPMDGIGMSYGAMFAVVCLFAKTQGQKKSHTSLVLIVASAISFIACMDAGLIISLMHSWELDLASSLTAGLQLDLWISIGVGSMILAWLLVRASLKHLCRTFQDHFFR